MKNKSCSAYTLGMPPFQFSKQTHGNRMFPPDGKNVFNSVSQINYSTLTMFVAKKVVPLPELPDGRSYVFYIHG